jgi:hypothetical protein
MISALKLAGGACELEALFDPTGENRKSTEAFRANVKAAIQSIQSPTGKEADLEAILEDLGIH